MHVCSATSGVHGGGWGSDPQRDLWDCVVSEITAGFPHMQCLHFKRLSSLLALRTFMGFCATLSARLAGVQGLNQSQS